MSYNFTGEPYNEEHRLHNFRMKARKLLEGDKQEIVFDFSDNTDFWWNPPWYVLNAIGGNNLTKHLKKSDNPDKSAETYIGYQPSLVDHDEFVVATHLMWQGSYVKTYFETEIVGDIEEFLGRLLSEGLAFTDSLLY